MVGECHPNVFTAKYICALGIKFLLRIFLQWMILHHPPSPSPPTPFRLLCLHPRSSAPSLYILYVVYLLYLFYVLYVVYVVYLVYLVYLLYLLYPLKTAVSPI
jgi:hypothetical protein